MKLVIKGGGIKETKMPQKQTRESIALPLNFDLGSRKLRALQQIYPQNINQFEIQYLICHGAFNTYAYMQLGWDIKVRVRALLPSKGGKVHAPHPEISYHFGLYANFHSVRNNAFLLFNSSILLILFYQDLLPKLNLKCSMPLRKFPLFCLYHTRKFHSYSWLF